VFTNVTVKQITQKGYAYKLNGGVRHVTAAIKRQVFAEYFGRVPGMQGHYEIDHLISLELGGSNDPKNLWPESYYTVPFNGHVKDKLEDWMAANIRHELERHGHEAATALLKQYQREIATAGAMLRGATRGAGADGMNTTGNLIGGCWTSDAKHSYAKIWRPELDFGLLTRPILAKTRQI
jgi:hypothetical protein